MSPNLRARLSAGTLFVSLLAGACVQSEAHAAAGLKIIKGSGEFQSIETSLTLVTPINVLFEWTTDRNSAVAGLWEVTDITNESRNPGGPVVVFPVVATGFAQPVPGPGSKAYFKIPATAFLKAPSTPTERRFSIRVTPITETYVKLGSASPAVTVTQVPPGPNTPFENNAKYPSVDLLGYTEHIGTVPYTQVHYAYADVTLRLRNGLSSPTDPAWLTVKDRHGLMRQITSKIWVPSLPRVSSRDVTVRIEAVLPPAQSQLPQAQLYAAWRELLRERCGTLLSAVFDFGGPLNEAPVGDHAEVPLLPNGWAEYADLGKTDLVCTGKTCLNVCSVEKGLRSRLDGHVVGYSFLAGQYPKFGAGGRARLGTGGATETAFTPQTKITVASVSKLVTALATLALIENKNQPDLNIDSKIGPYLPADWGAASDHVKNITFAQLLAQTSGIKFYGAGQDYDALKKFFTQKVNTSANTACQQWGPSEVANPINTKDASWCYSNLNTAVLRVILPKLAGYAEDANLATRPATLAAQYVKIVQENVFERVGRKDVACKPPATEPGLSGYAFAYRHPSTEGTNFGDVSLICGAVGWYLSAEDIGKVLMSLNKGDGRIIPNAVFNRMRNQGYGLDIAGDTWMEKNGAWPGDHCVPIAGTDKQLCDTISTSVSVFGPVTGPRMLGVLFLNSDIGSGPSAGAGARQVMKAAYDEATSTLP